MNNMTKEGKATKVSREKVPRQLLRRKSDREDAAAMEQADSLLDKASAQMEAAYERMAVTQEEIDKLKAESREVLIHSRQLLEEIKNAA